MPDDAPNPDAVIAETNNNNRSAIIAKSQAALAAAIAQVNGEPAAAKPAPKAEAVAAPVEAEKPVEETEAEPEPAAAAEQPPAEQPVQKVSAKLEAAARSQIRSRNQKREMEALQARTRQLEAELQATKEDRELAALVRQNPLVGIKKAGHDPARVVPDWLAEAAKPEQTPEQKAAEANQKKLDELEAFRQRVEDQQRRQTVGTQVAAYQQRCSEAIADKAAYEFVHRDGGTPALYEYIVDTFQRAKNLAAQNAISAEQLDFIANQPPSAFAAQMEKELRGKFGPKTEAAAAAIAETPAGPQKVRGRTVDPSYTDAAKNVRGSRSIRQRQDYAAKVRASVAEEPTTLSARNSGARTVPFQRRQTEKELIENAKRAFETGKAILRR